MQFAVKKVPIRAPSAAFHVRNASLATGPKAASVPTCPDTRLSFFRLMTDTISIEVKAARDVERQLARMAARSPKLAELPISPLFGVDDLVRLELALDRFAQVHVSRRSKRLVESVRAILSVARTRLRVVGAIHRAVVVAEARPRQPAPSMARGR